MIRRWALTAIVAAASTTAAAQAPVRDPPHVVRYLARVEAHLRQRADALPLPARSQGGRVVICFHIGPNGQLVIKEFCVKSGYPDIDALAMRALEAAAPFPPPPADFNRGLTWVETFDKEATKHLP